MSTKYITTLIQIIDSNRKDSEPAATLCRRTASDLTNYLCSTISCSECVFNSIPHCDENVLPILQGVKNE